MSSLVQGKVAPAITEKYPGADVELSSHVAWLQAMQLGKFMSQAQAWATFNGAVNISELVLFKEELSHALGMRPLEHHRLIEGAASARGSQGPQKTAWGIQWAPGTNLKHPFKKPSLRN